MKWGDFLNKVKHYKTQCVAKQFSISISSLKNLLYCGAFDSLIINEFGDKKPTINDYHNYFKQLSTAWRYTSTKKTPDSIDSVNNDLDLTLWQHTVNPLTSFDRTEALDHVIIDRGYKKCNKYPHLVFIDENGNSHVWDSWVSLIGGRHRSTYLPVIIRRSNGATSTAAPATTPALVGVIVDVREAPTKQGKNRLIFRMLMGRELSPEITIWADRDTNMISQLYKIQIKPGAFGICLLNLRQYKEMYMASLIEWKPMKIFEKNSI